MKNLKHFVILAFVVMAFASCSKDDDNNNNNGNPKNSFTYDGETYKIEYGFIGPSDLQSPDSNRFIVTLTTSGFTKNADGDLEPTDSEYSLVSFNLHSLISDDIENGSYTITALIGGDVSLENFALCKFNAKSDIDDSGQVISATSGTLAVIKNGNPYELQFEFTLNNGKTVSGYYKGNLEYIENFDEGGKPAKANTVQKHLNLFKH